MASLPPMRCGGLIAYPLAIVSVVLAAAVTLLLWHPLFSRNPLVLFYAAVVISAWSGGLGAGFLASAVAVVLIDYLFIPSFVTTTGDHLMQILAFGLVSVLVSWLDWRQKRALEHAQAAQSAAERANSAKDQFLAVLSHELRTPLTPALAASEAMESDAALPAHLHRDLQMIRRNIELEARLIDDLLDLTRISRGKLQLAPQPVDVHVIIRQVLDACRSEMLGRQLQLVLTLEAQASTVQADPARLQQVCWNLVRNAIKFTPEGGQITVRTSSALQRNGSHTLQIVIADTGIGIAPEVLPRVFDAFEQGDPSINRRFGGLGLGLAISRQLILMHGGTLEAASPGRDFGATFTVTLDGAAITPDSGRSGERGVPRAPRRLRLLLVEDHADTARIMARLLRSSQYEVETAGCVRDALSVAAASRFDLVISDLGLPDGTGIQLFEELKRIYGLRGIAVSGFGMEDDVQRCLAAGFAAHLTKPVNLQRLDHLIQEVASRELAPGLLPHPAATAH